MQIYRLSVNRESDCPIYFRVSAVFPRKFCPFPAASVLTHARARAYPCLRPCLPMLAPVLTRACAYGLGINDFKTGTNLTSAARPNTPRPG